MPIYEYQCQSCEHQLEVLRKISDEPLVTCPECGKDSLRKKVSAAAFRLKGGGWYETDFKTGDKKNLAGSSDAAGAAKKSAASDTSTTKKSSESSSTA
jgi:putative FmdB family regulatory protein